VTAPVEVSVVIPAFDAESTLGEQLGALAAQVGAPVFEVLVCDNGSRDATAALVRGWAARGSGVSWARLRLVDASARRGPAAARNVGARAAVGRALLFCDADDVVSPGWVAALHDALHPDTLVAGPWEFGRLNPSVREEDRWGPATFSPPVDVPLPAAGSGNLGLSAELFDRLGGFDERLRVGEDIDLCWRAQLSGCTLVEVPGAVLHVRYRTRTSHAFRQAFAYAGSDRQMADKYRLVIAAYARHESTGEGEPAPTPQSERRPPWPRRAYLAVRKSAAEVARLRHPGGAVLLSSEIGEWLGLRLSRLDRSVQPVLPPTVLPPPHVGNERRGGQ
jgi:glycosyltransferase involved in cell wall biosynthesis